MVCKIALGSEIENRSYYKKSRDSFIFSLFLSAEVLF